MRIQGVRSFQLEHRMIDLTPVVVESLRAAGLIVPPLLAYMISQRPPRPPARRGRGGTKKREARPPSGARMDVPFASTSPIPVCDTFAADIHCFGVVIRPQIRMDTACGTR